jgi:hypothetical protein
MDPRPHAVDASFIASVHINVHKYTTETGPLTAIIAQSQGYAILAQQPPNETGGVQDVASSAIKHLAGQGRGARHPINGDPLLPAYLSSQPRLQARFREEFHLLPEDQ